MDLDPTDLNPTDLGVGGRQRNEVFGGKEWGKGKAIE